MIIEYMIMIIKYKMSEYFYFILLIKLEKNF